MMDPEFRIHIDTNAYPDYQLCFMVNYENMFRNASSSCRRVATPSFPPTSLSYRRTKTKVSFTLYS
jgi:hypothetical protein